MLFAFNRTKLYKNHTKIDKFLNYQNLSQIRKNQYFYKFIIVSQKCHNDIWIYDVQSMKFSKQMVLPQEKKLSAVNFHLHLNI